jgi:hypothetical protein
VIIGSVRTDSGEIVSAKVTAYRLDVQNGMITPHPLCSQNLDDQGNFRCDQLQGGNYILLITPQMASPKISSDPRGGYPSQQIVLPQAGIRSEGAQHSSFVPLFTFYPNTCLSDSRDSIHLAAGQTQAVSLSLDTVDTSTLQAPQLKGTSLGSLQLFAAGSDFSVPIRIQPRIDPVNKNYIWDGLPSGSYELRENWTEKGETHEASGSITIARDSPSIMSFVDKPLYQVHGTITAVQRGRSYPDNVTLKSAEGDTPTTLYMGSVSADGTFAITGVPEGSYHIGFPLGNETAIGEALLSGRSLDDLRIPVNENTPNDMVVILPKIAHGSINGILKLSGVGGRPGVVVQAEASSSTLLIPANEDGSFRLYGLPAGEYRLFGWNDVTTVPYNSQSFLEHYAQHAVTMHIAEGESVAHIEVEAFSPNL